MSGMRTHRLGFVEPSPFKNLACRNLVFHSTPIFEKRANSLANAYLSIAQTARVRELCAERISPSHLISFSEISDLALRERVKTLLLRKVAKKIPGTEITMRDSESLELQWPTKPVSLPKF